MNELIYMCGKCNETFDESCLGTHICSTTDQDEAVIDDDEARLEDDASAYENTHDDFETNAKTHLKPKRDGWKEEDVKRFLDIYIKNFKSLPYKERERSHYLWDRVMKDLKQYGDFSRFLVQSKFKKLKNTFRVMSGPSSGPQFWPYYQQMVEIFRLESEKGMAEKNDERRSIAGEETESDDDLNHPKDANTQGLHRWTVKETRHLIQVYTKHLPKFYVKGHRRKILWNDVLEDLAFNLPQRFSVYQIRAKIRNVQNTYRDIVLGKRKKGTSHWPLFHDVAKLSTVEKKCIREMNGDEVAQSVDTLLGEEDPIIGTAIESDVEVEERSAGLRWNKEETEELLNEYKEKLPQIIHSTSAGKTDAWILVANKVNLIRRRKISPSQAREKIKSLKSDFENGELKMSLPKLNDLMEDIIEEEAKLKNIEQCTDDEEREEAVEPKMKKKRLDPADNVNGKKESLPAWYKRYEEDASRRHEEKMLILDHIVTVLERIISPPET